MATTSNQQTAGSDRGSIGVTPRPPTLEDESYMDFMQGVRNFAIRELFPIVGAEVVAGAVAAGLPADGATASPEEIRAATDQIPVVGTWKRVMRSQQQLTWNKLQAGFASARDHHMQALDGAERERVGGLQYDPDFEVPDYAKYPIHLQPGGYVGDDLAGYVFHHGTRVFYQGDNDQDELHQQVVDCVREPASGGVERVLDLACSIGQCTTLLKQRYPQAEVTGLDVSLPLLRYANRRAVDLDVDVKFRQGLAEQLPYPDGHFDSVLCYILFHEVPARLFQPIIDEVFRVLRPGGSFTVVDAPNGKDLPAPNQFWLTYDAQYNCEPYSPAFVACDLPGLLSNAGFTDIKQASTQMFLTASTAVRPE